MQVLGLMSGGHVGFGHPNPKPKLIPRHRDHHVLLGAELGYAWSCGLQDWTGDHRREQVGGLLLARYCGFP
jgi:hypothetical protein